MRADVSLVLYRFFGRLHKLGIVPYCGAVKQVIALVLVLSMLVSAQARAVHGYADHASHATHAPGVVSVGHLSDDVGLDAVLPLSAGDRGAAPHAAGHCDYCGHAGMVAAAGWSPPFHVFIAILDHVVVTRESRVGDPPVPRADKPPR